MTYNLYTRELRTDEGKLLKTLDCPLHKKWSELAVIPDDERKRHCGACQKCVMSLEGLSENVVQSILEDAPNTCLYIPLNSQHITIYGYPNDKAEDDCPLRRIHTARGVSAINRGAKEGYRPLVKRVERSPEIKKRMAIYQNEETGEVRPVADLRTHLGSPWKMVIDRFTFYPDYFDHEVAAYLVPPDLESGERVFLTDLIEDLVGKTWNQGHAYRLKSAYATWNGIDFQIDMSKVRVIRSIG